MTQLNDQTRKHKTRASTPQNTKITVTAAAPSGTPVSVRHSWVSWVQHTGSGAPAAPVLGATAATIPSAAPSVTPSGASPRAISQTHGPGGEPRRRTGLQQLRRNSSAGNNTVGNSQRQALHKAKQHTGQNSSGRFKGQSSTWHYTGQSSNPHLKHISAARQTETEVCLIPKKHKF